MFASGLSEIVLVVRDVGAAAKFYRDVLCLQPVGEPEGDWAWFWCGEPGAPQRLAVTARRLLFEEHSPRPPGKRFGQVHFALHVPRERLDGAVSHIRSRGVRVLGPTRFEWMRAESFYCYDPDGNLVELWSPDPPA
jgi:catechol-2,3-dioxygenase